MENPDTNRLVFLVPYLGTWPHWSRLFFESSKANPQVAVIIFCETLPPFIFPNNVKTIHMEKNEMVSRLQKVTGLNLAGVSGHKLCDFRPFFGLAFADFLQGYEFWGYCDMDMMFGDLSKLLTEDFFQNTDVFSAHNRQIVGHFTILRNVKTINQLCFEIESWQQLLLEPFTRALDEIRFSDVIQKKPSVRWRKPDSLTTELEKPFARFGITYSFFGETAYLDRSDVCLVRWQNGRAYCSGNDGKETEVLYVHFMATKHWWHWLFLKKNFSKNGRHFFSRIGYGGAKTTDALLRFPWKQFYQFQCALVRFKNYLGTFFRKILPKNVFLTVRRQLLGRGRY
jgi:hypothetical protein